LTNTAAVVALILGLLVWFKMVAIWQIMIIIFGVGTTMAFDIPGRQSFIFELVGKYDLPNAIALNSSLFNGTRALGPAFAGFLIAWVGMAIVFLTLVMSPYLPFPHRLTYVPFWRRHLWQARELWLYSPPACRLADHVMACNPSSPFLRRPCALDFRIFFQTSSFGFSRLRQGLFWCPGHHLHPPLSSMYFFWGMLSVTSLFSCTRSYEFAMICLFLAGFGMTITVSTGNSIIQLNVPDNMRGRVMSLFSLTFLGFTPLGNFLYGSLAHYIGPCPTVRLGTGLAALLGLFFFLYLPGLRSLSFTPDNDAQ
jgi:MFS family permease